MGTETGIQWCHHTFNAWRGCTKVSAGCDNCYADAMSKRNPKVLGIWGQDGQRSIAAESYWRLPTQWNAAAQEAGERHRVFCASLADVFEGDESMPAEAHGLIRSARRRLFDAIDATGHLNWLLLTKRPENIRGMWPDGYMMGAGLPPVLTKKPNVWLMTSVEDQVAADKRIPELMNCRDLAAVLGLSIEPLLGPVVLPDNFLLPDFADDDPRSSRRLVIVGGESGPGARPMHPDWARSIRDQCQSGGVPFFFKQHGEWVPSSMVPPLPDTGRYSWPWKDDGDFTCMVHVGKKAAGRMLDGRTWDEMPVTP